MKQSSVVREQSTATRRQERRKDSEAKQRGGRAKDSDTAVEGQRSKATWWESEVQRRSGNGNGRTMKQSYVVGKQSKTAQWRRLWKEREAKRRDGGGYGGRGKRSGTMATAVEGEGSEARWQRLQKESEAKWHNDNGYDYNNRGMMVSNLEEKPQYRQMVVTAALTWKGVAGVTHRGEAEQQQLLRGS